MALKGTDLRLPGSAGEAASDCLGDPRRSALGGRQYSDHLCHPGYRSVRRVPALEHEQPGRASSGVLLLFKELRGAGTVRGRKSWAGPSPLLSAPAFSASRPASNPPDSPSGRGAGVAAALGAGAALGNDVHSLPEGVHQRHESVVLRHDFHSWRIGDCRNPDDLVPGRLLSFHALSWTSLRPSLFWLFLGGFCWVIGDLFQQYAAKYIGIARGIPLSNTNQLWGLAWGALVFGELQGKGTTYQLMVIVGSLIIVAGAIAISRAEAPHSEQASWRSAMMRECCTLRDGARPGSKRRSPVMIRCHARRRSAPGGNVLIILVALGVFVWLAVGTVDAEPERECCLDGRARDRNACGSGRLHGRTLEANAVLVARELPAVPTFLVLSSVLS